MALTITQTKQGATGWAAVQQANLAAIETFVDALEVDIDGFPDELKNLTAAEIQQLQHIGAVTISAAQWGYLGGMTDTVDNRIAALALLLDGTNPMTAALDMGTFAITNVGNVDGVDVSALKTDVDGFPDELKNLTQAEIQQLENIGANTITAAQWAFLATAANIIDLTEAELAQLENIGATTISATQWGYLGTQDGLSGMTHRGDPATADFVETDLITNGAWHTLDLSAIVPAGAKTVLIQLWLLHSVAGKKFEMRKTGYTANYNLTFVTNQVANVWANGTYVVECSASRTIQYRAASITWDNIYLTVGGWWF